MRNGNFIIHYCGCKSRHPQGLSVISKRGPFDPSVLQKEYSRLLRTSVSIGIRKKGYKTRWSVLTILFDQHTESCLNIHSFIFGSILIYFIFFTELSHGIFYIQMPCVVLWNMVTNVGVVFLLMEPLQSAVAHKYSPRRSISSGHSKSETPTLKKLRCCVRCWLKQILMVWKLFKPYI